MFKRLIAVFLAFILTLKSAFSIEIGFLTKPFEVLFGEKGLFITIFSNEYILFGLYFIAMFTIFFKIIQVAIRPLFGNNRRETNTIAFSIAFMGISGIFFVYGKSPTEFILTFGSAMGLFLITVVFLGFLRIVHNIITDTFDIESFSAKWWFWMALFFVITINLPISVLNRIIQTASSSNVYLSILDYYLMASLIGVLILISSIFFIFSAIKNRKSLDGDKDGKVISSKNPEYKELVTLIDGVKKNLGILEKSFNSLRKILKI